MSFYVGQKVVCVNDEEKTIDENVFKRQPHSVIGGLDGLKRGTVYTIRWHGIHEDKWYRPHYCVKLFEIHRKAIMAHGDDWPFDARRFKPLDETQTDISVFKKMLVPAPKQKVLENA